MAPAATAAGFDAHDVAALDHIAIAQGLEEALIGASWIDDAAPGTGGLAAGDAPGRVADAVDAHGHHGLRRQHLDFADEAATAAPAPGTAGIGVDGVAPNAHRKHR